MDLAVGAPEDVEVPERSVLAGVGTRLYPEVLAGEDVTLDVTVLARIAAARQAAGMAMPTTPLYLRRPNIHERQARKRAL